MTKKVSAKDWIVPAEIAEDALITASDEAMQEVEELRAERAEMIADEQQALEQDRLARQRDKQNEYLARQAARRVAARRLQYQRAAYGSAEDPQGYRFTRLAFSAAERLRQLDQRHLTIRDNFVNQTAKRLLAAWDAVPQDVQKRFYELIKEEAGVIETEEAGVTETEPNE